ncbi:MAG TPA: DUF2752 domain-containing protein [Candidatus Angelobacter sp.]|nr:DUF2752 domain-containing protein [Candidatus Angelobacter sp.]
MKLKIITGALGAAFFAGLALVYNFSPTQYSFYPRCPFYAITHWLCPGCGATRALYSILHGDLQAALHYNAMFTLMSPVLLFWMGLCCYYVMRYDRLPRLVIPRGAIVATVFAVLLFTVARNTIFTF